MTPSELAKALQGGDRRALAKAITLIESRNPADRKSARRLLSTLRRPELSLRLGITGPPGVGKSTFIDKLGMSMIAAGKHPAVLAYDPSGRHGGSVLADKTRMTELSQQKSAFVRPSPDRGASGGIGPGALSAVRLCEAAGYDPVIIETVGTGQSEIKIVELVDLVALLWLPHAGDELQTMKKGILEHADLVLLNKADGDQKARAEAAARAVRATLALFTNKRTSGAPLVEVMTLSALEGGGVSEAWDHLQRVFSKRSSAGLVMRQRQQKLTLLLQRHLREELERELLQPAKVQSIQADVEQRLLAGALQLEDAVDEVLKAALGT